MSNRFVVALACAIVAGGATLLSAQRPGRSGDRPPPPPPRGGAAQPSPERVHVSGDVTFAGGYATDPRDGGRPVVLIAAALGVSSDVFRAAFSNVRPARNGGPTGAEARANKQVLLAALGPHGVTNDRLDEVSNYYRYRPQTGELWKHVPAEATPVIENGRLTGFKIAGAGSGYSSPPRVTVAGFPNARVEVELEFTQDLRTNGRIKTLRVVGP